MRRITFNALLAFEHRTRFKQSNTEVKIVDGLPELWLFNHKIAWINKNHRLCWTMAGYNTVTTRDRLNAILPQGRIWQCNFIPYYFGPGMEKEIEIDPYEVYSEVWK